MLITGIEIVDGSKRRRIGLDDFIYAIILKHTDCFALLLKLHCEGNLFKILLLGQVKLRIPNVVIRVTQYYDLLVGRWLSENPLSCS